MTPWWLPAGMDAFPTGEQWGSGRVQAILADTGRNQDGAATACLLNRLSFRCLITHEVRRLGCREEDQGRKLGACDGKFGCRGGASCALTWTELTEDDTRHMCTFQIKGEGAAVPPVKISPALAQKLMTIKLVNAPPEWWKLLDQPLTSYTICDHARSMLVLPPPLRAFDPRVSTCYQLEIPSGSLGWRQWNRFCVAYHSPHPPPCLT